MSFLSLTERDREEMLAAIGVESIDELFRDIPPGVRFDRELDLEPALSEQEISDVIDFLAWLAGQAPSATVLADNGLLALWAAFGIGFMGSRAVVLVHRARGTRWMVTGAG